MSRILELAILTNLALPLTGAGQAQTANPLVGAWKTIMFVGDPNRLRPSPVHPAPELGREGAITGLRLFTREHFTTMTLILRGPRPMLPDSAPTVEQLLTTWAPFAASGGRYELHGDTLIAAPLLAKNPRVTQQPSRYLYRVMGDTLFLTAPNGITEVSIRVEQEVQFESRTPSPRLLCPELLDSVAHALGWRKLDPKGTNSEFRLWRTSCAWAVPEQVIRVVQDDQGTRGEAVIWWTPRAMALMDSVQADPNRWTTWKRALEREHQCHEPVIRHGIGFCRSNTWSSATWQRAWQIFNEHHGWDLTQTAGQLGLDGFDVILEAAGSGKRVLLTYWMPGPARTDTEREVFQLEQEIYRLLYPRKSP